MKKIKKKRKVKRTQKAPPQPKKPAMPEQINAKNIGVEVMAETGKAPTFRFLGKAKIGRTEHTVVMHVDGMHLANTLKMTSVAMEMAGRGKKKEEPCKSTPAT